MQKKPHPVASKALRWPLLRQIIHGTDGTGADAMTERTKNLRPRTEGLPVARSICPYCGVGCGQLVFHEDGKIVAIEGDPASPISAGHLCPKGSASHELLTHGQRLTRVRYRAPFATAWQDLDLETAMDMIADRLWEARARSFVDERDGHPLMQCTTVAHLGGATLDNEENYLIKKLFAGGLGLVCVSNQARI
jgi:formate dehydrogenase major subunit